MPRSLAELNRLSAEKRARMSLPDEDPDEFFARRRAEDLRAGPGEFEPSHFSKVAPSVSSDMMHAEDSQAQSASKNKRKREEGDLLSSKRQKPFDPLSTEPHRHPQRHFGNEDLRHTREPALHMVAGPLVHDAVPDDMTKQPDTSSRPPLSVPAISEPGGSRQRVNSDVPSTSTDISFDEYVDDSEVVMLINNARITSFSKTLQHSTPKQRQKAPMAIVKKNEINFKPLVAEIGIAKRPASKGKEREVAVTRSKRPRSDSIEDISSFPPTEVQPLELELGPVDMREGEKTRPRSMATDRVSKHSGSRHTEKVVKLTSVPTSQVPSMSKTAEPLKASSLEPSSPPVAFIPSRRRVTLDDSVPLKPLPPKRKPKGKEPKPPPCRLTPSQYALSLEQKMLEVTAQAADDAAETDPSKRRGPFPFLQGTHIVYLGGDMSTATIGTRNKMDMIVKYGAHLMPEYDPRVTTHIISETDKRLTLSELKIKSLKAIPNHIPIVTWRWVSSSISSLSAWKSRSQEDIQRSLFNSAIYYWVKFDPRPLPPPSAVQNTNPSVKGKGKIWDPSSTSELVPSLDLGPLPQTARVSSAAIRSDERLGHGARGTSSSSPRDIGLPKNFIPSDAAVASSSRNPVTDFPTRPPGEEETDPLAEFYSRARADKRKEDEWPSPDIIEGHDGDGGALSDGERRVAEPVSNWTCDQKRPREDGSPNQDIIDKLTELKELHAAKLGDDDRWRVFAYDKALRSLRTYPHRIKGYEEAKAIKGVGEKTAKKIEEIIKTGELRRIKFENTEDVRVCRVFQNIYGVGRVIAHQWYSAGCRTLDDLRNGKGGVKLSRKQEIGLRYYDDINSRMPREEAKAIFDVIKAQTTAYDPKLFVEIMGSYRRGKETCGDIDILISRPTDDGKTHAGFISILLEKLHKNDILVEDLALPEDDHDLECVYRGLCRLPTEGAICRRIDILCVPWKSRGAALLYYTGDDIFNRAMRYKANHMGYSLNQQGLFNSIVRDPRNRAVKTSPGVCIASETEEEIFRILDVPWQEPHERVRNLA